MADPFIGEIRMAGFNFPPSGWAACNGALMDISQNDALFNLIGTTYGGDGQQTFGLPDLQSRVPIHVGSQVGPAVGANGGTETVTLTTQQIPSHNHTLLAGNVIGGSKSFNNNMIARPTTINLFSGDVPDSSMNASAILPDGGSQPHTNIQPYVCINFIISLYGIYPVQS